MILFEMPCIMGADDTQTKCQTIHKIEFTIESAGWVAWRV
jgi:hypothetical protein